MACVGKNVDPGTVFGNNTRVDQNRTRTAEEPHMPVASADGNRYLARSVVSDGSGWGVAKW